MLLVATGLRVRSKDQFGQVHPQSQTIKADQRSGKEWGKLRGGLRELLWRIGGRLGSVLKLCGTLVSSSGRCDLGPRESVHVPVPFFLAEGE